MLKRNNQNQRQSSKRLPEMVIYNRFYNDLSSQNSVKHLIFKIKNSLVEYENNINIKKIQKILQSFFKRRLDRYFLCHYIFILNQYKFIIMYQSNQFSASFLSKVSTHCVRTKKQDSQRSASLPKNFVLKNTNKTNNVSDIYFDPNKKSIYIKDVVQSYFEAPNLSTTKNQKMPLIKNRKLLYSSVNSEVWPHRRRSIIKNNSNEDRRLIKSVNFDLDRKEQLLQGSLSFPQPHQAKILPPINQVDDKDDLEDDDFSILGQTQMSTLVQINPQEQKQQRVLVFQNEAFLVYVVYVKGKPKYRLKQFKLPGLQILKREQLVRNLQIQFLWRQSKFNPNCLMSSMSPPIKDIFCKITTEYENKDIIHKITPKSYHKYLLENNNAQLINFIESLCLILKKCQGKILNNKINLSNIFLRDGKPLIAEWGHSAFRNQFNIQQNKMESRKDPILRSQNQWFVTPQYLAPQILHQMTEDTAQDIWQYPLADIWSLGCVIFEILTLIPLWSTIKCYLKDKRNLGRKGLLGTHNRNLLKIQQKQIKFKKNFLKYLRNQCSQYDLNPKILKVLQGMLEIQPSKRISLSQILTQLREK